MTIKNSFSSSYTDVDSCFVSLIQAQQDFKFVLYDFKIIFKGWLRYLCKFFDLGKIHKFLTSRQIISGGRRTTSEATIKNVFFFFFLIKAQLLEIQRLWMKERITIFAVEKCKAAAYE